LPNMPTRAQTGVIRFLSHPQAALIFAISLCR
jgi:hypothetical protein